MAMTVETLAGLLDADVYGDRQLAIDGARSLEKAGPNDVTFAVDQLNFNKLKQSCAGAVLISRSLSESLTRESPAQTVLLVDDAKTAFLVVLSQMRPRRPRPAIGISADAWVSPTARIGLKTNVHPGATIGADVVIGANCDLHSGVVIGPGCRLGDDVVLHPQVVLYEDVVLGNRVIVHASAVLGADGFGYQLVDGRHQRIPHFGTLRIEDDVEIGACTTIDRAMIDETVIGEGTKLDNLVMIAHNCEIGRHNAFVSQVALAGSVTTGEYVVCAGQVGVADHVHLGDGCIVGAKAGVHKDLPGGQSYLGAPAQPEVEEIRGLMALRKIPALRKKIHQIEAEIEEIKAILGRRLESEPASSKPAA